jgi:23S rRNA pseudouridine1911/1915/1917 synthase
MACPTTVQYTVPAHLHDKRIDLILASVQDSFSRTYYQQLIEQGNIQLNGAIVKRPSVRACAEDTITVCMPAVARARPRVNVPDSIPLRIIFEHSDFFIIEKPPYISVHAPAVSNMEPTVVDWLLTLYTELATVGDSERPGIVHRLDKDTSGLLIVSRNNSAHEILSDMFKKRLIKKTYIAVVHGHPQTGTIDLPIGRDLHNRLKMCTYAPSTRTATTHYTTLAQYKEHSLLKLMPVTGRTHQLRVHCTALGSPIVGDALYGSKSKLIGRQALHAAGLSFTYNEQEYTFESPVPTDIQALIETLKPLHSNS